MSPQSFAVVLQHFRRLGRFWKSGGALSDAALLERFNKQQDREAFAELVERHGPLVLRVCRRILAQEPDVEDAFQATFLILARKARSIHKQRSIANWLYTVAQRVAWNARAGTSRRRLLEQQVPDMRWVEEELSALTGPSDNDPARLAQRRELEALIEQEVGRLPEKYRAPLILCDLQGRTHTEAAQELGLPQGSVSRHLERGRDLLRERLARRGVGLGAAALAVLLTEKAQAAVPAAWIHTASEAAVRWASGSALPAGLISARAVTLSQGVLRAMWMHNFKMILLSTVALTLLAGGAGWWEFSAAGADPVPGVRAPLPAEKPAPADEPAKKQDELSPGVRLRLSLTEKPKEQQAMPVFMGGVKEGGLYFSAEGDTLYVQRGGLGGVFGVGFNGGLNVMGGGFGIGGGIIPPGGKPGVVPPVGKPGVVPPGGKRGGGALPQGGAAPGQQGGGLGFGGAAPAGGGAFLQAGQIGGGGGGGALGVGGNIGFGGVPVGGAIGIGGGGGMMGFANFPQDSLTVYSIATKKKVKEYANTQASALSPSGKVLATIATNKNHKQVVRLINAKTGAAYKEEELWKGVAGVGGAAFPGGGMIGGFGGFLTHFGAIAFTPDSKRLAVQTAFDVLILDTQTGKLTRGPKNAVLGIVGYMPDGKSLVGLGMPKGFGLLGGNPFNPGAPQPGAGEQLEGRVVVLNTTTGKVLRSFGDQMVSRAVLAPNGTTVATFSQFGLWGGMGGFGMPIGGAGLIGGQPAPAPDKKETIKIQLWDASTGKLVATCDTKLNSDAFQQKIGAGLGGGAIGGGGFGGGGGFVAFFGGHMDGAFSQDGRILASCMGMGDNGHVYLWDTRTGKELAHLKLSFHPQAVALSRDGTMLAAAGGAGALDLRVWDVAEVTGSGSQLQFDATQFPVLWNDLASDDLSKAFRAERTISAGSAALVLPLLKEKLKPAPASSDEGKRIAQLVADLESDQFKVRDKATQELARGGVSAAAALNQALNEKHTIEFQRRAHALLSKLEEGASLTPDQRRQQRALTVVESMGTAEARQFLDQLASGTPEAWFTQEARTARARFTERKLIPPSP